MTIVEIKHYNKKHVKLRQYDGIITLQERNAVELTDVSHLYSQIRSSLFGLYSTI